MIMDEDEEEVEYETEEAFVLVQDTARVSRDSRAKWIIDSLFREKENIYPDKIDIIGHTKNGDITDEVDVIFIFKRYRFVFLFDLSSSAIRVNRLTSMVIVDEMLEAFEILLENLLKDYQVPGQFDDQFITPEVFCTLIGFLGEENGHVVFEQDRYLTKATIPATMELLREKINYAYEVKRSNRNNMSDEGLVPMLRTGILALQLLPSNSIAGIVIFTDGCSDIYSLETSMMMREGHVRAMGNMLRGESNICDILNRLRNQTISCSFVQVTENTPMNAFGLVPNEHLMKFISAATHGMYINLDFKTRHSWPPKWWMKNRESEDVLNPIARGLMSWSFQKGLYCWRYLPGTDIYYNIPDIIRRWHKAENLSYSQGIINKKQVILYERDAKKTRTYDVPLETLISCHLREGFTVKEWRVHEKELVSAKLLMPWKPTCHIVYAARRDYTDPECTVVTIAIEGQFEFLMCELNHKKKHTTCNVCTMRAKNVTETNVGVHWTQIYINELHNTDKMLETLFMISKSGEVELENESRDVWKEIISLPEHNWQKWFHTHKLELILKPNWLVDHVQPNDLFLRNSNLANQYPQIGADSSDSELGELLLKWKCSLGEEGTISWHVDNRKTFVYKTLKGGKKATDSSRQEAFVMIRKTQLGLVSIIRVAFNIGITIERRGLIYESIKDHLTKSDRSPFCHVLKKPLGSTYLLIKYKTLPRKLWFSPLVNSKSADKPVEESSTPNWHVFSYLHQRRFVWEVKCHHINALNEIMMDLFKDRLDEGFKIVFSGNDGPITLADEGQFEREPDRMQQTHDREDTGIIQIVLFPPIELPRKFPDLQEDSPNGIKISTFHLATEVWVEPRRGKLAKGPPGCEGKDFLEIAQIQMTRDHQIILFDTTFNLIKTQCKAKKPWDSSFAFSDLKQNKKPVGFENCSGVKEVKMKFLDFSLEEEFENRMDRIFFANNTLDIGIVLYHGDHRLFGFSLLESTSEDPNVPNQGNEVLLHQFHEVLKIRSDISLVLDSPAEEICKDPIQEFLCEILGIRKRDHKESGSTVTDYDNYEDEANFDSEDDGNDKAHSAGSFDGLPGGGRSNLANTPHWSVYARYVEENDSLIITALPERLCDVTLLERISPQIFEKICPPEEEPRNSDFQGMRNSESESEHDARLRKDSEVSYGRSSYTSDGLLDLQRYRHRGILPVLVTVAERSEVRKAINQRKAFNKNITVMNKCWKPELIESMQKQESVRHERNNSFSPFVPRPFALTEETEDAFTKYFTELEDLYNRSFVRGVYHTLGDKSVSNTPVVSSTDFHIALYEHCVPEEKKIVITEAILAWCPEWRAHFDEQMRQNEAACDNLDDVDDDGSSDDGSSINSPKTERASFFMGEPKPEASLDDRSPPPQLRNRSIDVNTPRRQHDAEEELETASKCSELLYENIGHYFRLFADDQDHECSTFYFVEPDYTHGEYSPHNENFSQDGFGRDNLVEENISEEESDIVFEHQQANEEQKTSINDYDFEQMSCEGQLLATITDDEPQANVSDLTNAESDRSNFMSSQLEDEPTLHQPLFLQMEMQIWASGECNRRFSGETIPLKKRFFTSVQKLVQKVNSLKAESEKINRVRLDDIKVQLVFSFFTIPSDVYSASTDDDAVSFAGKIPLGFEDKINKTLSSIEMIIEDEIVAARRKQSIITKEILEKVKNHVEENESISQTDVHRHNLMCNAREITLDFVNEKDDYDESIERFRENLLRHGYFGSTNHGFSLPSNLFESKDDSSDVYQDFQFDLKLESNFFYVTLTPRKGSGAPLDDHGSDVDIVSIQSSNGNGKNSSHASLGELNGTLDGEITLPTFVDQPYEDEDREVQSILSPAHKRGSRSHLSRTPTTLNSAEFNRTSGESSAVRRMSHGYKDDHEDLLQVPNFWLIMEITLLDENELKEPIEDRLLMNFSQNRKVPVMKLYHHRRRADNPFAVKIQGERISYGTTLQHDPSDCQSVDIHSNISRGIQYRDPNVTDADECFIQEIEDYIKSIVQKVNQMHLLHLLSTTFECHPYLVESGGNMEDDIYDFLNFNPGEFACAKIHEIEKQLHPRITKRPREGGDSIAVANLKKKFQNIRVKNRANMFVIMERERIVYFFIDRKNEEAYELAGGPMLTNRTVSMESYDQAYSNGDNSVRFHDGKPMRLNSSGSINARLPALNTQLANRANQLAPSSTVTIDVHGLSDDFVDGDIKPALRELERKVELVLYNATLQALTTTIHRNRNELLSSADVSFLQPRLKNDKSVAENPSFSYFFPIQACLFANFRRFSYYLSQILESTEFQVFMTANHIQYEKKSNPKSAHSAGVKDHAFLDPAATTSSKGKKKEISSETPFLRHNTAQGQKLKPEEVIIFNANLRRKNFPQRQNKRASQHIPSTNISYQDPTQAKIAVISYEVYQNSNLIPTKSEASEKSEKKEKFEIFLDDAESIIQEKVVTDEKLKEDLVRFKENGYSFPEPTIVFHMWMQDYRDSKDNFESSTFRPSVHGVGSMVYKSLSRLVRAAVFDSLMELVVLQKPIGMNFDRPMCPLESRRNGTKTCPKEASSSRRRKDSLNTESINLTKSLTSKKSLFHSSSEKVDLETSYQKSRGISFLKSRNSEKIQEKTTTRNTEKASVENGETGALHNYYKNQFRDWIRKESKSSQNAQHANDVSHPTINFIDFSRGNQIRVPSWKIFERSCVSPIKNKFSELWAKSACSDDQENICRVFYRAESEGDFIPSAFWKNVKTVSGEKVECAMFLRDNDDWQRCTQRSDEPPAMSRSNSMNCLRPSSTRNYAKFGSNGNSSNDDHELSRQSCAMLTLENSEECDNPKLRLYMYNVSENLGDQMIEFLKKLLTAQLVRYELLTAITKLKLGLSQPIQHSRQYENLPSGNQVFPVNDHRKSKKCYDYQDVVDNNVENLQKPAPDKSVVINSFCAAFRNTSDIPVLEIEGDPPTNHGRQFLSISESKKASKSDEQDSRLPQILHEWAEATKDGRLHEHEISHADLQLIKTYSTVKHFEEEPIWFHFHPRGHVINNPTRHNLRKRNTTPPGIEVSRMRPRAKVLATSDRRQRPGVNASRRMNNLGAQPPTQFDQQSGRRRRQKQAFFELISKHVSSQFPPNSLRNIQFSDKDDSFSTISFQFCVDPIFAVVFEILIDLKRKNTSSLTVFALNMALVSSERDDFDYCEKLASLDSSIDQNVEKLVKTFNFSGILAEVHLSIVFQDWSEYYSFEIRKMCKTFPGTLRAKESLFPLNFDYTDYLSFLQEQNIKKKLVHGDFMQGSLVVPYTHNIPAKDFFKYLVKDSTLDHDCDTKPIQFVELRSERKIMDAEENRSHILLQREYDAGAYKTVAIIYHDDSCETEKEELKELKLAYWIVAVRNPDKPSKMTFAEAIALVKKEVTSKDAGLPKLFDNVGEKCYKDHLWKLQQTGSAALSDLKELLNNADVAVLEISHELDERLKVLNRLGNEWLKKLGTFISEECSKDRIQISAYEDKGKCRHLAVFNQSGDYKILILLTVSDNDEETRIRALLKDIPRGTKWEEVSRAGKHRNSWVRLRTEIENFMVAITLFLVKTMLDD